jgi:hypothetical protein
MNQEITTLKHYRINWNLFCKTAAKKVIFRTGISETSLRKIKEFTASPPIKALPEEGKRKAVLSMLYLCTNLYLGVQADKVEELLLKKTTSLIIEKFGELGVSEIDEAFSLAATKVIEAPTKAFYGTFNINSILELLTKYRSYRNRILKEVRSEIDQKKKQLKEQAEAEEKNKLAIEEAIDFIQVRINMAKEGVLAFEHYSEIPSKLVEIAYRNKGFKSDEDKASLYAKCLELAKKKIRKEAAEAYAKGKGSLKSLKEVAEAITAGGEVKGAEAKAQIIFFQLLLWNKLKQLINEE